MYGGGVALLCRHKRVAYFVVCHYALFFGRYNRALALVTGNNSFNAFLKVLLNDRVASQLYRAQSRFVYNVGKLGTACAAGCAGNHLKVDIAGHLNVARMNLQYGYAAV